MMSLNEQPTLKPIDEVIKDLNAMQGYLMWGTVSKAYQMLNEMRLSLLHLAVHVKRMEADIERIDAGSQ